MLLCGVKYFPATGIHLAWPAVSSDDNQVGRSHGDFPPVPGACVMSWEAPYAHEHCQIQKPQKGGPAELPYTGLLHKCLQPRPDPEPETLSWSATRGTGPNYLGHYLLLPRAAG